MTGAYRSSSKLFSRGASGGKRLMHCFKALNMLVSWHHGQLMAHHHRTAMAMSQVNCGQTSFALSCHLDLESGCFYPIHLPSRGILLLFLLALLLQLFGQIAAGQHHRIHHLPGPNRSRAWADGTSYPSAASSCGYKATQNKLTTAA